jgi:hypothetical protein
MRIRVGLTLHPPREVPVPVKAPEQFESTFPPYLLELFVEALKTAYYWQCWAHATIPGHNAQMFGLGLYHLCAHHLELLEERTGQTIRLIQRYPSYIFRVGEFEVICLNVGERANANIYESFPNASNGGVHEAASLFLPGLQPDVTRARRFILAHLGNPTDGLGAVYLTVAARSGAGTGIEWVFAHRVYIADSTSPAPTTPPATQVPPAAAAVGPSHRALPAEVPVPDLDIEFLTDEHGGHDDEGT